MAAVSPVKDEEFYIAAIDQGTSSSRVMIYDSKGQQVASHQVAIPHIKPKPGYVAGSRYLNLISVIIFLLTIHHCDINIASHYILLVLANIAAITIN